MADDARPATHIWCHKCRDVTPLKADKLAPYQAPGYDGDIIRCAWCKTVACQVFVAEPRNPALTESE